VQGGTALPCENQLTTFTDLVLDRYRPLDVFSFFGEVIDKHVIRQVIGGGYRARGRELIWVIFSTKARRLASHRA